MVCKNGHITEMSTWCVMDIDLYGDIIGCRDLSHLENCGKDTELYQHLPHGKISGLSVLGIISKDKSNVFKIIVAFFYPLPNNKNLDWSKLKALANGNLNEAQR